MVDGDKNLHNSIVPSGWNAIENCRDMTIAETDGNIHPPGDPLQFGWDHKITLVPANE